MTNTRQYLRVAKLIVLKPSEAEKDTEGLDLSEMHFVFNIRQSDYSAPNTAEIRVFNVSDTTIQNIRKSYNRVVVEAGYPDNSGVIFDGTIKQYRIGRRNNVDSYIDILAADGDIGYNFGVVNASLPAGSTINDRIDITSKAITGQVPAYKPDAADATGGVLPRGKVLFGMAKARMHDIVGTQQWSWSIQKGKIQVIPLDKYLPNQAIEINSNTGMVGIPRSTENGIELECLLNPRVVVGGLIKLNAEDINKTIQQDPNASPFAYDNPYRNPQFLAKTDKDGLYRVYVAEHHGDTRGNEFYTTIVGLAVDPVTEKIKPYG